MADSGLSGHKLNSFLLMYVVDGPSSTSPAVRHDGRVSEDYRPASAIADAPRKSGSRDDAR
jgi:hypothetical protein